jgi:hypothetical protein
VDKCENVYKKAWFAVPVSNIQDRKGAFLFGGTDTAQVWALEGVYSVASLWHKWEGGGSHIGREGDQSFSVMQTKQLKHKKHS